MRKCSIYVLCAVEGEVACSEVPWGRFGDASRVLYFGARDAVNALQLVSRARMKLVLVVVLVPEEGRAK